MKRLGVFLLPLGWDATQSQEHKNTTEYPWSGLKHGPLLLEANALTRKPPRRLRREGCTNKIIIKKITFTWNWIFFTDNFFFQSRFPSARSWKRIINKPLPGEGDIPCLSYPMGPGGRLQVILWVEIVIYKYYCVRWHKVQSLATYRAQTDL